MLDEEIIVEKKKLGFGRVTIITIIVGLVALFATIGIVRVVGRNSLKKETMVTATKGTVTNLGEPKGASAQEGVITYNGKEYVLNEDLISILVMGIDAETYKEVGGQSWSEEEGSGYAGGQADALFLILMNPHDKNVYILAIDRNAMADVDVFDEDGNYKGIQIKQIALQHGYGDGKEQSCERQVKAVSRMLHDIPIDAYIAISMDAVPELNDLVGGITVEVLEDIVYPEYDMDLHQGETVKLEGDKAYWYIRLRQEDEFGSNEMRLQRQKQYMTTFAAAVKNEVASDIRVAADLYSVLQKYMVSNIDLSQFIYLATEYRDYEFDVKNLHSLPGETVMGNNYEEFYIDDAAAQDLLIKLFYEPVEEETTEQAAEKNAEQSAE